MKADEASTDPAVRRSGIVVQSAQRRYFVPAEIAKELISEPTVTPVPGADFGMALVSGQVVVVVALGKSSGSLLVCEVEGEILAVAGVLPQRSGFFEATPGGVRIDGELVADLDVGAMARALSRKLSGASDNSEPA
jgi:hypothetical protein